MARRLRCGLRIGYKIPVPRQPMYRPDGIVDRTLSVSDLLIPHTGLWDVQKVRQLFIDEDIALVLSIKPTIHVEDRLVWSFTRDGSYSSQSGYKLIDTVRQTQTSGHMALPPM